MLGRVASTGSFIAAGGNCVGAMLGGLIAAKFGITAPYWTGFVVAVLVSAGTWRVFNRAAVAEAYAEPALGRNGVLSRAVRAWPRDRPPDYAVRTGGRRR